MEHQEAKSAAPTSVWTSTHEPNESVCHGTPASGSAGPQLGSLAEPGASGALAAPLLAHWGVSETAHSPVANEPGAKPVFIPIEEDSADIAPDSATVPHDGSMANPEQHHKSGRHGKGGKRHSPATHQSEATGIGQSLSVGEFVTAAKDVEAHWDKLKPKERADKMAAAANAELTKAGVPKTTAVLAKLPGNEAGELNFSAWELKLGSPAFSTATTDSAKMADAASTIYHESRHAEQWFRMARLQAGKGKKASEIKSEMGIPARIAAEAAKNPLTGTGTEEKEAEAWYDSVYGTHAKARNEVLKQLAPLDKKVKDAAIKSNMLGNAYALIEKDPKADEKRKKSALDLWLHAYQAWQAAAKEQQANYQAYRNLPEEADAWKTGDSAKAKYQPTK